MEKEIDILKKTRSAFLNIISGLTTDQMNEVPPGFNNNIIWNLSHMIAAQQGVCYVRGNLPMLIEDNYFQAYKPDTKPEGYVTAEKITTTKALLLSTIDALERDLAANKFVNNPPWTNRFGVEHKNIADSIKFLVFHDGLHIGYSMALKRIVSR